MQAVIFKAVMSAAAIVFAGIAQTKGLPFSEADALTVLSGLWGLFQAKDAVKLATTKTAE